MTLKEQEDFDELKDRVIRLEAMLSSCPDISKFKARYGYSYDNRKITRDEPAAESGQTNELPPQDDIEALDRRGDCAGVEPANAQQTKEAV